MRNLLSASLLCFAGVAHAGWISYGYNTGMKFFIDLETKKLVSGNPRVWTLYDRVSPERSGLMSTKILYEADCKESRIRALSVSTFAGPQGGGGVLSVSDSPESWTYPAPESFGVIIFKVLCGKNP